MTSKGVFLYSYMTRPSVLLEIQLPGREHFFNDLDCTHVMEERYAFTQEVWKAFKCVNLMDYLHVYLLVDYLLLVDVFENYRDCCLSDYRLDPVHYFSSPHFTFNTFDQYLFLNRAMPGGLSMVSKRYSKANHPNLKSGYDPLKLLKFLFFLDANNLYGKAMMEPLPVGGFRWMRADVLTSDFVMSLSKDGDYGCFMQSTLLYPPVLHRNHDDYPLAPVKRKIIYSDLSPVAHEMCDGHNLKRTLNKEKLLATFEIRKDYVLHYRNLQLYLKLGLQVLHLKAGLLFRQK